MEPFAKAASGRPEGASVTQRASTMSTYNSLLVWRTFARRQGIAGPFVIGLSVSDCFNPPKAGGLAMIYPVLINPTLSI